MYSIMKDKNEGLKKHVIQFTRELVRTPSMSLKEADLSKRIESKMKELKYDKVFSDDAGNVVGVILGRQSEPSVLLNSHMDTVDFGDEKNWTHAPFSADIENGKMYGLGTADCKSGLAAQIYAGALLKRCLFPLKGNLIVAATVAEENGRSVGVRELIERTIPSLGMRPDYAILGDPTGLGIYYGHDGWMEMEIQVKGDNPFLVNDASLAIYDDFDSLDLQQDQANNNAVYKPIFSENDGIRNAKIKLNRRLHLKDDCNNIINHVEHNATMVAQAYGNVAVDVAVRQETQKMYNGQTTVVNHITNAWSLDPFHTLMDRSRETLAAADCEVRPGKWELGRLGMGTAGSLLVTEYDIPAIGYGPGEESLAHGCNEYVDVDQISEAVYGTAVIVQGLIGSPIFGWTSDDDI